MITRAELIANQADRGHDYYHTADPWAHLGPPRTSLPSGEPDIIFGSLDSAPRVHPENTHQS